MAGLRVILPVGPVSVAQATTLTLVQVVAPTNQRLKLLQWGASTDGKTSNEQAIRLQLLFQTTAGTASALTPKSLSPSNAETIQSTAQVSVTAEPTAGTIVRDIELATYNGQYYEILPFDQELTVPGAGRLAIRVISPATMTTLNITPLLQYEE